MKKTLKKRAFISAIAMLIVSAIVLTSSTFAWFAMATQVNVNSMELNITSLDGIVFSANTSKFTTKLTKDDFVYDATKPYSAYKDNHNNLPTELIPSSSKFDAGGKYPVFYSGSIDDDGYLKVQEVKSEKTNGAPYVAVDLFIKLAKDTTVVWDSELSVKDGEAKDPLYAMRVGVIKCAQVAEKAAAKDIVNKYAASGVYDATVWEMDDTVHTVTSGETNGEQVTTLYMNQATPSSGLFIGTDKHITTSSISALTAQAATRDDVKSFDLKAGVTRIRVYIWLEGQDCDCESAIAGSVVNCSLSFSISK